MSVVPATIGLLEAYRRDPAEFADLLGSALPDGWPEFPEGIEYTLDKLLERPDQADWWLHLFLDVTDQLVGSGGYVGPPDDGVVEIGYEIAPEFRNRGYATAAARALVAKALADPSVHTVLAHTLPADSASTAVLRKVGFQCTGEAIDPEEGTVWRWQCFDQQVS